MECFCIFIIIHLHFPVIFLHYFFDTFYAKTMTDWRNAAASGIAQAIMKDPHLLILDEPTNGLDEKGVEEIRELFGTLCDEVYEMDGGVLTKRE